MTIAALGQEEALVKTEAFPEKIELLLQATAPPSWPVILSTGS